MRHLVLILVMSSSCFADLKYRIQTTGTQGRDWDRIVYVRGDRIRTEMLKLGRVNIRQCDLNRIIRLDSNTRTYRIVPILPKPDVPPTKLVSNSGPQVCRGKARRQVEETGESEQLLGVEAQHLRIWIYSDPVPESCPGVSNPRSFLAAQRDGWYVEVPTVPECPARDEADRLGLHNFDQPDRYVRTDGSATPELLPVKLEVKVPHGQQLQTAFTAQVSELSTQTLDAALFDIPPDYQPAPGPDCSNAETPVATLEDGTPVFTIERTGCGISAPKVTYQQQPEYTERARKKGISGTVQLSLTVDPSGGVRDVKVERSLEPSLDQAAANSVRTWKFDPATKDGQPVAVRLKVEVSFSLYAGPRF